jgi:hypothetical protein
MRTTLPTLLILVAFLASGCGATRRTTTVINPASPTLTSAAVSFVSRDHGKDKNSTATVRLMRNNAELVAEANIVGNKFDDYSISAPLALSLTGTFKASDIDDGNLRVRFVPDGRDEWTFDTHLTLRFSDGSARNFAWSGLRLDNTNLERTLALAPARIS